MSHTQSTLEKDANLIELSHLNEFLDYFFQFYDPKSNNLQTNKDTFKSFKLYYDQAYKNVCLLNDLDELNQKNFIYVLIDVFFYIEMYYLHARMAKKHTRPFYQYLKILLKKDFRVNGEPISINDLYDLLNMEVKLFKFSKQSKKLGRLPSEETLVESLEIEISPRSVTQVLDPNRFLPIHGIPSIQTSMNYKQDYPKFFYSQSKLNYYPGFQNNTYNYTNSLNNLNSYYNGFYNMLSLVK
ncbi:hypothetical protein BpHYR1_047359 [Brachionus plicatilis]|uniref:Uncharacterized protein n=1 Tax=Brachionus plicatilis TaxID=10195 RepID=A0A3M7RU79_BRAPC|nr:hypothetical protein BpHYR1_047359 [Brachionus plicatilis]